jgi:pimeloyl-ACP methyl ester carboxylesterase
VTSTDIQSFHSFDGVRICWRELGSGHPFVLLHGLFSNVETNWLKWETAQKLAEAGIRVIMPYLRAHGASDAPHDPAAYPPDVLARDVEALIDHLRLTQFDLGGYSLGARTAIRVVVRGAKPRRLILAGMGLEGILHSEQRTDFFLRVIETRSTARPGSPEWMAAQFMRTTGVDPDAAVHVLTSQVPTSREDLSAIDMPTLVVSGADDRDNGSGEELAAALRDGSYRSIPGNHMSAVMKAELAQAMLGFLD